MASLLDAAGCNSPGQCPLKEDKEKYAGKQAEQSRGTRRRSVHIVLALKYGNGKRNRPARIRDQQDHGQEEFVPGPDKEEHKQHREGRHADGHDNPKQQLQLVAAIDESRFNHFSGEGAIHR